MSHRVLHVVESLTGVLSSVLAMVEVTPDLDHHLAVWPLRSHADTGDDLAPFTTVTTLARQPIHAVGDLRQLVRRLAPDRLHAHSSYAGVVSRVVDPGVEVVYSPHCFAFERRDAGRAANDLARRVERALVRRTSVLVACSPHEAGLARELGHRDVVTVPNRPLDRPLDRPDVRARFALPLRVVAAGRLCPQKDWRYLLTVKGYLEEVLGGRVEWEWLGGGDPVAEDALRARDVHVTGWMPRTDVVKRLAEAQVFVHTAAWEGAPISILEATSVGLPVAARGIPTLVSLGVPGTTPTAADLAGRILALADPDAWAAEQRRSLLFAAAHSPELQEERLRTAYRLARAELVLS
ncbi:glycosyltransferase involved in cell wall biosynthesis [Nocardioides thalensis]|uniref:Glycosyltransferase involved in cell wall biosynthesis n=1 Tax=Nocardioides thalensis TaxID=1914755 RepID=A0A853C583_9ACTN|nr:glycosyltransferase [Nocardioides thalensis]NYJ01423.1 glycosyltransferase involved in cell wall biosynthesis [Nocardioides thalensis]